MSAEDLLSQTDGVDFDSLAEGICPLHGSPLERRERDGYCESCKTGYALTPDVVRIDVSDLVETVTVHDDRGVRSFSGGTVRWEIDRT